MSSPDDWSEGRNLLLQRSKTRALSCLNEHEYSRAFAHFIVALTVEPEVKGELLNAFLYTLEKLTEDMENNKQFDDVLMCYERALEVLPHDSHVLHGLGSMLYRLGYVESAASYFLKSYKENPFFTPSLYCMENLKNALVERWHFTMLNDMKRNLAYKEVITRTITDGYNHVLDIGAGTGILSMMACDAGATKVYACEASEIMCAVLNNVVKVNEKDVKIFSKYSNDLSVPDDLEKRVNLVVTEIFDAGLFGEHSLEILNHAWENLLINENPDEILENKESYKVGKVIPQGATLIAVPIECKRFSKYIRLEDKIIENLKLDDLTVLPHFTDEEPYSSDKLINVPGGYKMLSKPSTFLNVDFNSPQNIKSLLEGRNLQAKFECITDGHLDAMAIWFDLQLDKTTTISTCPTESYDDGCWEQAIFYVFPQYLEGSSSNVKVGDFITANFECKGHLTLKSVNINSSEEKFATNQCLYLDPSTFYFINSYTVGDVINLNLQDFCELDNPHILDISTFPVLGLKLLRNNIGNLTVVKSQFQTEIEQLRDIFQITNEQLVLKSYEELYRSKMQCDLLIVDPVELCGLLKKNLFEDIAILKKQCLKESGKVLPGEIEIYAILIDSDALSEQSKIISDERTSGYKIAQIMNAYQCHIHQDIYFSTLPHQKITKPVKLSQINLNYLQNNEKSLFNSSLNGTKEVEMINSGKISAIVYWFHLKYSSDVIVNTCDEDSLWRQGACILEDNVSVTKGEKALLQWSCKNGCLHICLQQSISHKSE